MSQNEDSLRLIHLRGIFLIGSCQCFSSTFLLSVVEEKREEEIFSFIFRIVCHHTGNFSLPLPYRSIDDIGKKAVMGQEKILSRRCWSIISIDSFVMVFVCTIREKRKKGERSKQSHRIGRNAMSHSSLEQTLIFPSHRRRLHLHLLAFVYTSVALCLHCAPPCLYFALLLLCERHMSIFSSRVWHRSRRTTKRWSVRFLFRSELLLFPRLIRSWRFSIKNMAGQLPIKFQEHMQVNRPWTEFEERIETDFVHLVTKSEHQCRQHRIQLSDNGIR